MVFSVEKCTIDLTDVLPGLTIIEFAGDLTRRRIPQARDFESQAAPGT
jgi:hypothetical protein